MLRIGLVCFLGAFIGALVALQIGGTFWWVGAIAGALVAYLGCEPKSVAAASRRALGQCLGSVNLPKLPSKEWWKVRMGVVKATTLYQGGFTASWGLPIMAAWGWEEGGLRGALVLSSLFLLSSFGTFFIVAVGLFGVAGGDKEENEAYLRNVRQFFRRGNPLSVAFFLARASLFFLPALILWAYYLFRLIHSEARLVCALDAALGAAVGYFAGNALVGGLAGGMLGIGHFWLARQRRWGLAA